VRALSWLRQHLCETPSLEVLAAVAGVRPRTLEAHFARYVGRTPLGVARALRLAHARRVLADSTNDADVTTVAQASGFSQPGRFAGDYRRAFGELPSQTRQRARLLAGANDTADDEAARLSFGALQATFAVAARPCERALAAAARASELAPGYALPKAISAWCLGQRIAQRLGPVGPDDDTTSCRLAREAGRLAPHDSLVLTLSAGALALAAQLEEADRLVERAVAVDPWSPWARLRRGWLSAYLGDNAAALRELRATLQLMPFEPIRHLAFIGMGCAWFGAGHYQQAAQWARDGVNSFPDSYWGLRVAAAAAWHAGARPDARRMVGVLRRNDPELTVAVVLGAWAFPADFMDRLGEGLARAGLPRR